MLKSCIRAERKKLRSSAIWLLFLIVPVFPAIMGTFNYIGNLAVLKNGWYSLWTQHTLFYTDFFYAPLIAAYAAYLWRMEHLNHNWNFLMTAPVPLKDLILAKFIVLFQMTVFTQIWIGILFFVCGKLAGLPGLMPLPCIFWLFRGCIGSLGISAVLTAFHGHPQFFRSGHPCPVRQHRKSWHGCKGCRLFLALCAYDARNEREFRYG